MRRYLFISASVLALAHGHVALAGEGPIGQPGWEGLYFGLYGGFANVQDTATGIVGTSAVRSVSGTGGIFGIEAGKNWQFGQFVLGVEGDIGLASTSFSTTQNSVFQEVALRALATARVRAGYAAGHALFFVTGGLALADIANSARDISFPSNSVASGWRAGLVGGGGVEFMVAPNMTLKVEGLATNFSASGALSSDGYAFDFKDCVVVGRAGLNFRF